MSWCIHFWDAVALLFVVASKALRELSPSSDCNRDLHSSETPNFPWIADLDVRYYLGAVDWTLLCSVPLLGWIVEVCGGIVMNKRSWRTWSWSKRGFAHAMGCSSKASSIAVLGKAGLNSSGLPASQAGVAVEPWPLSQHGTHPSVTRQLIAISLQAGESTEAKNK